MKRKGINYRRKMKRSYSISSYKLNKKRAKFLRDNFSPDPFKKLDDYGIFGKVCGKVGNKLIGPAIRNLSLSSVGKYYKRVIDKPEKGTWLYTLFHFLYTLVALGIVTLIVFIISGLK